MKDWCRRCDLCAARKKPEKAPSTALKRYNVGALMERVALDVLGPLPEIENRTLEAMLPKFVTEKRRDWDEHLPLVMMAYKSSLHETTGCTPSLMMLGRQISLPVDLNGSTVIPNCKTPPVIIVSNDVNIFCKQHAGVQQDFEDQTPVLITFTREGSTQYNHTIRIRTRSGTAQSGSDFLPIDKVLTFVSGQTRIEQNVTVVKDNNVEQDESFRLEVTSSDNRVNVLCPKIDFVIRNDDSKYSGIVIVSEEKRNVSFVLKRDGTKNKASPICVSEEKRNVSFVLKREGTKNKASPIWYSTVDGTAYDKADYKPVNQKNVTFQPGQEYMTLSVEIVNDQINEEDETFAVVIGSHVSTTLTSSPCTNITIKDKDLGEHAPHPLAAHAFGARCYVRTFEKKHATPLGFCNNIFFILQSAFHRSKRKGIASLILQLSGRAPLNT
ncbi:hypothetical protein QZH41_003683 [Actinostola sp. cb2023]|nr:hypothetical protein QZH41_003683 [Actinostola sp. cb2023]